MTLEQFFKVINYRITGGDCYLWKCYGPNCRSIDSWDGDHDGKSFSCYHDTENQTIYEVQAHDYKNNRSYRWQHPDFIQAHTNEALNRGIDKDEAWDEVKYINLELEEDWLDKADSIMNGREYDTRVLVPLELHDTELFELMKMAHNRDITLNKMMEEILWEAVNLAKEKQCLDI